MSSSHIIKLRKACFQNLSLLVLSTFQMAVSSSLNIWPNLKFFIQLIGKYLECIFFFCKSTTCVFERHFQHAVSPSKCKCRTVWYKLFLLLCCITCRLQYSLLLLPFKNTHQLPEICHNKKCAPSKVSGYAWRQEVKLVFAFPACHWKTLELYQLFFCCEASRQNLVLGVSPVAAAGSRITGCSVQPS